MTFPRAALLRPGIRARLAAGFTTIAVLLPLLLRLPRVSVVACFDTSHGLYQWVPALGESTCISAPTPVVSWTLMIAATLLVQLLLLPLLLTAGALLLQAARRGVSRVDQALLAALGQLASLIVPTARPVPIPVRTRFDGSRVPPENPRRGPPNCG